MLVGTTLGTTLGTTVAAVGGDFACMAAARWRGEPDAGDDRPARQYAPDRRVDVFHLALDITPHFDTQTLDGVATMRFAALGLPTRQLWLDAIDLTVHEVTADRPLTGHHVDGDHIVITFAEPLPPGAAATVRVVYGAEPKAGLYFRTAAMGYVPGDDHLFTQGEAHLHPYWFPSYDYPNERFTTDLTCRVPAAMEVLSNGRRVADEIDPESGLRVVRWLQDKPHVNYLVAVAAGYFEHIEEAYGEIPLEFHTPRSEIAQAANSFRHTADMMAFFEQEIGIPYPWDGYKQVAVADYGGGMENTTLTILGHHTLFTDETEEIRSSQGLVAHELVHQWFGDLVTCKDWANLWLNEGFATYYATLYDGHLNGHDSMLYELYGDARSVTGRGGNLPIVHRRYEHAWDQFDYRAYPKGQWVLHMLRTQLGQQLYRDIIYTYTERNAWRSVVTEDLNRVVEEMSGRSFDRFFDQWVYHGRHPELAVSYGWDAVRRLARVTVEQTQDVSDEVLLFNFSTRLRFVTDAGTVEHDIEVSEAHHDFYVPLPAEPTVVRFDPDFGLLCTLEFDKPKQMLFAQLADTTDVIGRLRAAAALAKNTDAETVAHLRTALNEDPSWGVRVEAAKALGEIGTDAAFEALVASQDQAHAKVRLRVVGTIGDFYRDEAQAELLRVLDGREKNPAILAAAIRDLGNFPGATTRKQLLKCLESTSYRNRLARAAIDAIRSLDDPEYGEPLRKSLKRHEARYLPWDFGRGLRAVGYLARHEDRRDTERRFLIDYLDHGIETTRIAALQALGELGDPKAIGIVETFDRSQRQEDDVSRAARDAVEKMRIDPKPPAQLTDLREQVRELETTAETLREEVDDLEARFEATGLEEEAAAGTDAEADTGAAETSEESEE